MKKLFACALAFIMGLAMVTMTTGCPAKETKKGTESSKEDTKKT